MEEKNLNPQFSGLCMRIDHTPSKNYKRNKSKKMTRDEMRRLAEKDFDGAYFMASEGNECPKHGGIVMQCFGKYPYSWEISIATAKTSPLARLVRRVDEKIMKTANYFSTFSYYRREGENKLIPLLGDNEVLMENLCKKAVETIKREENLSGDIVYQGDFLLLVGGLKKPCRRFDLDEKMVIFDLTNGFIFLEEKVKLEERPLEEKFAYEEIRFKTIPNIERKKNYRVL